jgi:class 3 adenylate cyclase
MAVGGLKFLEVDLNPLFQKNYTQRVVDLAIAMVKFVQSSTFAYGTRLNLKIGVHHGSCIFGVIGYHKPQFSLIGDTVNTTSR